MRRHDAGVRRVIRRVIHDESAAQDVMQDTWVRGFTHLRELSAGGAFSTWIRRIAFHEALLRLRRAKHSPFCEAVAAESICPQPDPERLAVSAQLGAALDRAIATLPALIREVFWLRSVQGCSVAETAAALRVPEQTVKTRHFRARGALQERLASWFGQTDVGASIRVAAFG